MIKRLRPERPVLYSNRAIISKTKMSECTHLFVSWQVCIRIWLFECMVGIIKLTCHCEHWSPNSDYGWPVRITELFDCQSHSVEFFVPTSKNEIDLRDIGTSRYRLNLPLMLLRHIRPTKHGWMFAGSFFKTHVIDPMAISNPLFINHCVWS